MRFERFLGLAICLAGVFVFFILNIRPVWGDYFFNCGELFHAARLAVSAQHSISNGELPLQFANDYEIALRPIFLYYTPVYYGMAGSIQLLTGLDPYRVILLLIIVMALSAVCGTYFVTRQLGGGQIGSGLAAATIPFSPYFLTDAFARGALAELSAWAVFPWMAYSFLVFCKHPRMPTAAVFTLVTSLLILSHKIFLPWAAILLAIFGILLFGARRLLTLSPHLILCGTSSLALTAPYWANAALLGDHMNVIKHARDAPFWPLTANLSVFWPLEHLDPTLVGAYPHFSLQLGPLIVFSAVISLFYFRIRGIRAAILTTGVASLFVCSFFNVFMFWPYLPRFLLAIQFPYRFLMFATTFGTIASGLVLTAVERKSRVYAYGIFGLALAVLLGSFWWHASVSATGFDQIDTIDFANGGTDYFELNGSTPFSPGQFRLPRSAIKAIGNVVTANVETSQQGSIVLPVQYSERLTASVNGLSNEIVNTDGLVSLTLPVGSFNIRIQRDEPVGFLIGPCIAFALFGLLAFRRRSHPQLGHERV